MAGGNYANFFWRGRGVVCGRWRICRGLRGLIGIQCGLKVLPVSISVLRRDKMRGQPSALKSKGDQLTTLVILITPGAIGGCALFISLASIENALLQRSCDSYHICVQTHSCRNLWCCVPV